MKTILFREREVRVPQSLQEFTRPQYEKYILLAAWVMNGIVTLDQWRERLFCILVGTDYRLFSILKEEIRNSVAEEIKNCTEPFISGGQPAFNCALNILPEYHGYKGPGDWLNGLEYGKFVKCATLMEMLFLESGTETQEVYEDIARELYGIPEEDKVPFILVWHAPILFSTVWKKIQTEPIPINGQLLDLSIIFKRTGERKSDDKTGWTGISFEVASAGVFGNIHELEKSDFWEVIIYL